MIKYTLQSIKEVYGEEIKRVFDIDIKVPQGDFAYISVKEIKEKLAKEGIPSKEEGDFSPEEERAISQIIERDTGQEFAFVYDYPHKNRAFYHMKDPNRPEFALGFDSLADYFEYFEYGCPPHGGFALGTERFLMKLLNYNSILETTYLPNTPNRLGKLLNKAK
jgi:aspartyl-tRNA synthetase